MYLMRVSRADGHIADLRSMKSSMVEMCEVAKLLPRCRVNMYVTRQMVLVNAYRAETSVTATLCSHKHWNIVPQRQDICD